jgi:hypothetical protein
MRLCGCCLFCNSSGFRTLLRSRGLALHLHQELLDSGGWAATSSGFPHRVPPAFVALLDGLGRRYLLQARKLHHQHMYSRHRKSTTLLKTAYLLRRGLRDLQLLGHSFVGRIARPPWRRGQTSLQASRRILNERDVR